MTEDPTLEVLARGDLELRGRLAQASNATFLGEITLDGTSLTCVYKPIRGERPLWDFPTGTLTGRELATYTVSDVCGWDLVPPTVLGGGPFGPGMVQAWVDVGDDDQVDIVPEGEVPPGWLHVLDAYDATDTPVSLVHADTSALRSMALLDVLVNNADRKGGHVLVAPDGTVHGCDHGVTFHVDDKLRTVLWGWADEPLAPDERARLVESRSTLSDAATRAVLTELVSPEEYDAMLARLDALLAHGRFPTPGDRWPSIPWPAF